MVRRARASSRNVWSIGIPESLSHWLIRFLCGCAGISIGLCCGTAFGVSGKGKPNSDNPDDEASKPIDPDDPDDEDLNEDTDQYN